jgi:hypothetical protein
MLSKAALYPWAERSAGEDGCFVDTGVLVFQKA